MWHRRFDLGPLRQTMPGSRFCSSRWRAGAVLFALAAPLVAWAGCARPYVVPVAPIGISVIVNGDQIGGIYPRMLHGISIRHGCEFKLSVVPQARLEALFETGQADLMMPATHTPLRDRFGQFVPLIETRATLLSIGSKHAPIHSVQELLTRRELRVALVRGNDYGSEYQAVLKQLTSEGRAFMEVDATSVARLLAAGSADVTILTPMSFTAALKEDARIRPLLTKLRIEPLHELPWHESGVYVSRLSVSADERAALAKMVHDAFASDNGWDAFRRYYPPEVIAASARQR